jgi:formylmethanofuran:tetrahydromethanopterin formyltransferase
MFMGLAVFIGSGVEVSASSTETTQYQEVDAGVVHQLSSTNTIKDVLIPADQGAWLGWVFMGFGMLNVIFIVKETLL